jgi:hypothetical protein
MPTQEISDYVTGLSSATLTGAEEVYLATDEKTTVNAISTFNNGNIISEFVNDSQTSVGGGSLQSANITNRNERTYFS